MFQLCYPDRINDTTMDLKPQTKTFSPNLHDGKLPTAVI
jgi:hypothetical protein